MDQTLFDVLHKLQACVECRWQETPIGQLSVCMVQHFQVPPANKTSASYSIEEKKPVQYGINCKTPLRHYSDPDLHVISLRAQSTS